MSETIREDKIRTENERLIKEMHLKESKKFIKDSL